MHDCCDSEDAKVEADNVVVLVTSLLLVAAAATVVVVVVDIVVVVVIVVIGEVVTLVSDAFSIMICKQSVMKKLATYSHKIILWFTVRSAHKLKSHTYPYS